MIRSHHRIATGVLNQECIGGVSKVVGFVKKAILDVGFVIISTHKACFPGGGRTQVWILAESHVVIHFWVPEGFATVDIHICDYRKSNKPSVETLTNQLTKLLFADPNVVSWEMSGAKLYSRDGTLVAIKQ